MNILCVDDDAVILTQYEHVLGKHLLPGDVVFKAASGEAGVSCATTNRIDVVFCDLVLPDISGLDVMRRIRDVSPATEFVVLTGFGSIDTAVEAIKMGARDYLTKPVNSTVLVEKMETVREVLSLAGEAEDYRFAKEVVEEQAHKTIQELEIRLSRTLDIVASIKTALSSSAPDSDRLLQIAGIVAKAGV